MKSGRSKKRVFFAMGPGDSVDSHGRWLAGDDKGSETAKNYTALTLDYVAQAGVEAWLVSSNPRVARVDTDVVRVENRPKPGHGRGALAYHWQQFQYCLSLAASAIRFKATDVVIDSGTTHWFLLAGLSMLGKRVFVSFHNTYYPIGHWRASFVRNVIRRLDGLFFRHGCAGALGVSEECRSQFAELGGDPARCLIYRAIFDAEDFKGCQTKLLSGEQRNILYVGRIEKDKGVMDLLQAAAAFQGDHPELKVHLTYCGQGNALQALKTVGSTSMLLGGLHLPGQVSRTELLAQYVRADVVVVPTTSRFMEGFPKVCAEALLTRRPLVISSAVPTIIGLQQAALVYRCDDPDHLQQQLAAMLLSPALHAEKASATAALAEPFTQSCNSLTAALHDMLG
jgi:glycogen synthase